MNISFIFFQFTKMIPIKKEIEEDATFWTVVIFIYFSNKAANFICTIFVLQASSSSDEDVLMTICKLCKQEFPDMARRLSLFIKYKSETKCNICQMPCSYFRRVKNFKSHMKICNGVNNYQCPHCKKVFKKWEIVTCTYTNVHKESNARYVVLNLAMKKDVGNMF